jgi:hypothetical protein
MQFMVVESFRGGRPQAVYARFRERGRLAPAGLRYVASWVSAAGDRCFQLMECDDPALLEQWTARWDDLVAFEIVPVIDSAEAAARFTPA